ncbi:hypothetical protein AAY473_003622 [Plecturocebus cupreus]
MCHHTQLIFKIVGEDRISLCCSGWSRTHELNDPFFSASQSPGMITAYASVGSAISVTDLDLKLFELCCALDAKVNTLPLQLSGPSPPPGTWDWLLAQNKSWAQWLTPVITALWEAEVSRSGGGVQDQPGQHSETLSLLKIQKLARPGGGPL